ncbi:DUF1002 domain-containing protein [Streptococcus sciuri]|uniref:DUF1002 domain-containing protein n=1 Tax=Streptococcus sciuri TaxID=2973939 RepID=A0ABT2F739_9STRE|nr:DUF1002 domain-containing protein [Streptococcus sciuri]MCS4487632.1 DUF1002 domain-containing protein [Streptococcus sciuri]
MHLKKIIVGVVLVFVAFFSVSRVDAATSSVQKVIDESYVQPDYVLGYSLSDSQRTETLSLLGYDSSKDTNVKTLTTSAYAFIMDVADDSSLQLYSSVKIKKLGASKGLSVSIVTPENITKVTQDMYRNAAITLGIEHAEITVASPIQVTGESALAGIYYSLEKNGATVSAESKALAQEELNALSDINAENQNKAGYDADKLNVAMTDIKSAIADGGSSLSESDIRKIVEDTLSNYGLKDTMTNNQITIIVNFAVNLSKSSVIKNSNFKSTLTTLKNSIVSKAKSTFSGINLNFDANSAIESSKGFFANLWQQIVTFFTNLFS